MLVRTSWLAWAMGMSIGTSSISAFAQTYPPDCNCPPAVHERLSRSIAPMAAGRVVVCSKRNSSGCNHDVEMSVKDGKCLATLDYCVVCVRVKDTSTGRPYYPDIKWRLVENGRPTNNYKFNVNDGIDIPDAGKGGNDHFHGGGQDGGKNKFKWKTGPDPSGQLQHWPVVYPAAGGEKCDWVDPIIVNRD